MSAGILALAKHAAARIRLGGPLPFTLGEFGVRAMPGASPRPEPRRTGLNCGPALELAPLRVNAVRAFMLT